MFNLRLFFLLLAILLPASGAHAARPSALLVRGSLTQKKLSPFLAKYRVESLLPERGWFRVHWDGTQSVEKSMRELKTISGVDFVERDFQYTVDQGSALMADPRSGEQWSWSRLGVDQLWNRGIHCSKSVVVAVIDTGIDMNHPDLRANLWVNPREIAGNGRDDDGNGFVDDVHGWDFEAGSADADDDFGHGTHVSGILGAVGGNGIGVNGVCWQTSLMSLKWMKRGLGWNSDAIKAVQYAIANGARVINASWGGVGYSRAMEDALELARSKGILFIASAGNRSENNDETPWHPASYRVANVVSVAATDLRDTLAPFSNWGARTVSLAAPGVSILSTLYGGSYGKMSGTSMAAPHVAGLVAMALSIRPELSAETLKRLLIETSDPVGVLSDRVISGGRVSANRFIHEVESAGK